MLAHSWTEPVKEEVLHCCICTCLLALWLRVTAVIRHAFDDFRTGKHSTRRPNLTYIQSLSCCYVRSAFAAWCARGSFFADYWSTNVNLKSSFLVAARRMAGLLEMVIRSSRVCACIHIIYKRKWVQKDLIFVCSLVGCCVWIKREWDTCMRTKTVSCLHQLHGNLTFSIWRRILLRPPKIAIFNT